MYTNTISQAASMETHGIPNDLLPNINTVTIIILMPLFTYFLYPLFRHFGIPFQPLARMAVGFFIEALGMGYTAGVQAWIYKSGPCYEHPRSCPASKDGSVPNHVTIAAQIPIYIFQGLSETFAFPASKFHLFF
jgi:POT family proton-dependent oligopeptide transporter